MEQEDLQFDDPGLARDIRRAWGTQRAPQHLRARIGQLMASAGSVSDAPAAAWASSASAVWRGRLYGATAAAILLLSAGALVMYYRGAFDSMRRGRGTLQAAVMPSKVPLPLPLAESMIATHGACSELSDHHLVRDTTGGGNYSAMSLKLTADLGFPVLARSVGDEWSFRGAGQCAVAQLRGSHLMFARGDQMISLFSLPSHCMRGASPGAQYEGILGEHVVAGFARSGAVYSIVGSGGSEPLSLQAVVEIRDELLGAFGGDVCSPVDLSVFIIE